MHPAAELCRRDIKLPGGSRVPHAVSNYQLHGVILKFLAKNPIFFPLFPPVLLFTLEAFAGQLSTLWGNSMLNLLRLIA